MTDLSKYDQMEEQLRTEYPEMFSRPYGGVAVGEGWWPIIKSLCRQIDYHIKWKNEKREKLLADNPYNDPIPDHVEQVVVTQIKEKFGGLRFYYDGGDERVYGMVCMAESWAAHTCEECGVPGKQRSGGWIRTLCDHHEEQYQARMKADRERRNVTGEP